MSTTRLCVRPMLLLGVILCMSVCDVFADLPTLVSTSAADVASPAAAKILRASGVRGGLVVHYPCGDGRLTAALRAGDGFIVQGLGTKAEQVRLARQYVREQDAYGPVSIDFLRGRQLPYADNLVNLIVIERPGAIAREELLRVLAPGGVMMTRGETGWEKTVKPRPSTIDQWTHAMHGPDNNAVANDQVVGPPRHFQWISQPRFSRSHDHLASVSAVVSAQGRLFVIVDNGSTAFAGASSRWQLIARDAFSGVRLWTRDIGPWEYHLRDFRSGPIDLDRRLVAVGDRVFVTLGLDQPVSALDAATGRTVRTYPETAGTQEILCEDGVLYIVTGQRQRNWPAREAQQIVEQPGYKPPFERDTPPVGKRQVMAVEVESGKVLWQNTEPVVKDMMPATLAVSSGRVYFQSIESVVCLDARTGQVVWKASRPVHRRRLAWSTPTLVVHHGVVFSADRRAETTDGQLLWIPSGGYHDYIRGDNVQGEILAFDAATGRPLWRGPAFEGFNAPVDVLVTDDLVWSGRLAWGRDPGITQGRDPRTGEVRRSRPPDQEFMPVGGHARCFRTKATSKYLILGRRGVEFVDLEGGGIDASLWVRGMCQFGVLPANGLLYIPPHACACRTDDLLKVGFAAFAPKSSLDDPGTRQPPVALDAAERLERGPAYDPSKPPTGTGATDFATQWPAYRHDPGRSGSTAADIPARVKTLWTAKLGGKLSPPVIADNTVLVAERDAHRVCAVDAADGRLRWTFDTGARIDSPPAISHGRAFFGAADGWVYCLRLTDGQLAWKFHAALQDRSIVVDEQLESIWPVSGSVLVMDQAVYFVAGRTSHMEGGMALFKLDAISGQVRKVARLSDGDTAGGKRPAKTGYLPDILSSDGTSLFLRSKRFDLDLVEQKELVPHLWSSVGFLDDTWWHRTYWQYGTSMSSGWGGWPKAGQRVPAGRLLSKTATHIFGYGRNQYDIPGAHVGVDAEGIWGPIGKQQDRWTFYRLYGASLEKSGRAGGNAPKSKRSEERFDWTAHIPVLAQGMVSAGNTLFLAGPTDPARDVPRRRATVDLLAKAITSTQGGQLVAVSAKDGQIAASQPLASPPVFDGLAAAEGRLYLSAKNGELVCLGPARP